MFFDIIFIWMLFGIEVLRPVSHRKWFVHVYVIIVSLFREATRLIKWRQLDSHSHKTMDIILRDPDPLTFFSSWNNVLCEYCVSTKSVRNCSSFDPEISNNILYMRKMEKWKNKLTFPGEILIFSVNFNVYGYT